MKSYIAVLSVMFLSFTAGFAQCFEEGSKVIEPGIGLGLYKLTFTDKSTTPYTSGRDSAGAVLYPVAFEYGLLDWLGCGGKFNYSNYIEDSLGKANGAHTRGIDLSIFVRAHALRTKRVDLFAGFEYGYSNLKLDLNNGTIGEASGGVFSFNLNSRFYFSDRWGVRLFYNFDTYNFPKGTFTDVFGNSFEYSLKLRSFFLFGAGLMFKLT